MDIGLLKVIIKNIFYAKSHVEKIDNVYSGSVDKASKYYFLYVEKRLGADVDLICGNDETMNYIVDKRMPLFKDLAKYKGDANISSLLRKLSSSKMKELIENLYDNDEYLDELYEKLEDLQKLGVKAIEIGIKPNGAYGIDNDTDYGLAIDYMDSIQLCEGSQIYNYKPTDRTKQKLFIGVWELPEGKKLVYGDTINVKDILDFNVDNIPTTVADVENYIEVINNKNRLYKEKMELENMKQLYADYSKALNKLSRVVNSRGFFSMHNTRSNSESIKYHIDEYTKEENQRIKEENKNIETYGFKVRI